MSIPRLIVGSLALPFESHEIQQGYERFGGFTGTPLRFANGAALTQHRWEKLRTHISGSGWIPPGLAAFDWKVPYALACVAARSIQSASNAITLPSARRNDVAPYGFAVTDAGLQVPTPAVLAGDVLTLTAVAGAAGYTAQYYPLITVTSPAGIAERTDSVGLVIGWELIAEEI